MVQTTEHPTEGTLTSVGIATRFSRTPGSIRWPAPNLGADRLQDVIDAWCGDPR